MSARSLRPGAWHTRRGPLRKLALNLLMCAFPLRSTPLDHATYQLSCRRLSNQFPTAPPLTVTAWRVASCSISAAALTLMGHGATIFATTDGRAVPPPLGSKRWPRTRRHLLFLWGEGIVIRDLTVKGAHPAGGMADLAYVKELEAQHGFEFRGTRGVELDRVTVTDVYGDFVCLGGYGSTWTRDVHIHDSRFERNGR